MFSDKPTLELLRDTRQKVRSMEIKTGERDKDGGREVLHMGSIDEAACSRILRKIRDNPGKEVTLVLSSAGGLAFAAMAFYDLVRYVLRPKKFTVIGSARIYSAAVPVFMAGTRRVLTKHSSILFHQSKIPVPRDVGSVNLSELQEVFADMDSYYKFLGEIVECETEGKLVSAQVMRMKKAGRFLSPGQALAFGIAHEVRG